MGESSQKLDHVDYDVLDAAKNDFIEACKSTADFAQEFGFIPGNKLGASANVFELDLQPFLASGQQKLHITLLPEGLGTADEAHPADLSDDEARQFLYNIGIKTVGVLTNDAASTGMQTVLISLYLPSSNPEIVFNESFRKGFLKGFVDGCKAVKCTYFSGETPQLKTKITPNLLDIAGALFGIMPPGIDPIDGSQLSAGDKMVFVASSGPDANGFTSLRELASKLPNGYRTELPSGQQYWQALNNPTVLLTPIIRQLFAQKLFPTNIEPITGHGWQKIMRSQKPLRYRITEMLPVPEVFTFVQEQVDMTPLEMISIFNYGLGFVLFFKDPQEAQTAVDQIQSMGHHSLIGGVVEEAEQREVVIEPLKGSLSSESFQLQQ